MRNSLLIVAVCLLGLAACNPPRWNQLYGYTFEQYVADFRKSYENDIDYASHKTAFEAKLAAVIAFNEDSTQTYKKGINAHSDQPSAAPINLSYGYNKNMAKASQKSFRNLMNTKVLSANQLPTYVNWVEKGVTSPVKDQGHCGSCWAFASTATIESHAAINSGQLKTLSTQQLVDCAPNTLQCGGTGGCQGSIAELAFNYVQLYGMTSEYKYSYSSYFSGNAAPTCQFNQTLQTPEVTLDGYVKLPSNNYEGILTVVATQGPVAVAVDASTWHDYETGVFNGCSYEQNIDLNHVVVIEGYGTDPVNGDYWLVRNSWGTSYGEDGYIRLAREKVTQCGTDYSPLDGQACIGQNVPTKVCGQCGVLFDGAFPLNAQAVY